MIKNGSKRSDTIDILKRYNTYKKQIEMYQIAILNLEPRGVSGLSFNNTSIRNKYNNSDPTGNEAILLEEKKRQIENSISILENKIKILDLGLSTLAELDREVLILNFIKGKKFFQIAEQLHISEGYAKRIKKRAINKMSEILKDVY